MQFEEMENFADHLIARGLGPDESAEENPHRSICRNVLILAMKEALGMGYRATFTSAKAVEARYWILEDDSGDFERVCDLAEWDADWIRRKIKANLACIERERRVNNATHITL
jgi:hypothetical protein